MRASFGRSFPSGGALTVFGTRHAADDDVYVGALSLDFVRVETPLVHQGPRIAHRASIRRGRFRGNPWPNTVALASLSGVRGRYLTPEFLERIRELHRRLRAPG